MTSKNDRDLSKSPEAFTGYPEPELPTMRDMEELSRLGQPTVTSPDTISSPPSTGSNSCFPSPSMSELNQSEGTVGAAENFMLASTLRSSLNHDVTAQSSGIQPSLFNQIHFDLTVSEAAQTPHLDNFVCWPYMVPLVAERPESIRRGRIRTSLTKICDFPGCGKVFSTRNSGNLARHKMSVHTQRKDRDENLCCQYCNVSFSRKDGKRDHNKRRHTY